MGSVIGPDAMLFVTAFNRALTTNIDLNFMVALSTPHKVRAVSSPSAAYAVFTRLKLSWMLHLPTQRCRHLRSPSLQLTSAALARGRGQDLQDPMAVMVVARVQLSRVDGPRGLPR